MNHARALLAVLALCSCGVDAVYATESTSGPVAFAGRAGTPAPADGTDGTGEVDGGGVANVPPDAGTNEFTSVCGDGGICSAGTCCGGNCCAIGQLCCSDVCTMPTLDRPFCTF